MFSSSGIFLPLTFCGSTPACNRTIANNRFILVNTLLIELHIWVSFVVMVINLKIQILSQRPRLHFPQDPVDASDGALRKGARYIGVLKATRLGYRRPAFFISSGLFFKLLAGARVFYFVCPQVDGFFIQLNPDPGPEDTIWPAILILINFGPGFIHCIFI